MLEHNESCRTSIYSGGQRSAHYRGASVAVESAAVAAAALHGSASATAPAAEIGAAASAAAPAAE